MTTYNQTTSSPTRKVVAAGIGGLAGASLAGVLIGLIAIVAPEAYDRVPAGFEGALGGLFTAIITVAAAYMTKESIKS